MGALYAGLQTGRMPALPPLEATYSEYAAWEQDWLADSATLAPQRALLEARLAGFRRLELLTDKPRPSRRTNRSEIASQLLDRSLTDALANLARRHDCTFFMTAFAGLLVLLHRYSGEVDISVSTQVVGRDDVAFENLVGTFVNTLPLRADLSGNPAFVELLDAFARHGHRGASSSGTCRSNKSSKSSTPSATSARTTSSRSTSSFSARSSRTRRTAVFALVDMPSRSAGPVYDLNFFMVERPEGWRSRANTTATSSTSRNGRAR